MSVRGDQGFDQIPRPEAELGGAHQVKLDGFDVCRQVARQGHLVSVHFANSIRYLRQHARHAPRTTEREASLGVGGRLLLGDALSFRNLDGLQISQHVFQLSSRPGEPSVSLSRLQVQYLDASPRKRRGRQRLRQARPHDDDIAGLVAFRLDLAALVGRGLVQEPDALLFSLARHGFHFCVSGSTALSRISS